MSRRSIWIWGALGLVLPAVVLIDMNLLSKAIFTNDYVIVALWPSSVMMSGTHEFSLTATIGFLVSLGLNVLLYVAVGFVISKVCNVVLRSRRI
jgi:hypothetical protein